MDFKKISKELSKLGETEIYDYFCSPKGIDYIAHLVKKWELSSVYLAGCSNKQVVFEDLGEKIGVPIYSVNIREFSGWVHGKGEATRKAARIVESSIAGIESQRELSPVVVGGGKDVLLAGDYGRAQEFADLLPEEVEVTVIAKDGSPAREHSFIAGEVKEVAGELGEFDVSYEMSPIDSQVCLACGRCQDACPVDAISLVSYSIADSCTHCGKCIEACPVDAISFEGRRGKVKASQVVLFGDWSIEGRHGMFLIGDGDIYSWVLSELIPGFYRRARPRYIEAEMEFCAGGKSTLLGCQLCEVSCPSGAVVREGEKVRFSAVSCTGCGACVGACPLSVLELATLPQAGFDSQLLSLLGGKGQSKKVIAFTCKEQWEKLFLMGRKRLSYPPILPLFVPCVKMLSISNLLLPFSMGADGVALLGCGEGCRTPAIDFANRFLEAYGMENVLLEVEGLSAEDTAGTIKSFSKNLGPTYLSGDVKLKGNERERLQKVLKHFSSLGLPDLRFSSEKLAFGHAEVSGERCTLCNTCISMCPTFAITKASSTLEFSHSKCINCRLCERACPEGAIKIRSFFNLKEFVGEGKERLAEEEMLECEGCGRRVISAPMLRETAKKLTEAGVPGDSLQIKLLEYCTHCRGEKSLELLMEGKS